MSEPIKVLRLNKVASELGRSVEVIVDFLHKKGFSQYQKDKPNDKVSPEAHDVLLLEFSTDKALKEQAEKRMEDKVVTKEVVTAPEKKVQTVTEKEDDNLDEILEKIKTESVENELKASKKKAAEKAAPVVEAPKAEAPKKEDEVAPVVEKEVAETPVPEAEGEVKPLLKTKLKGPKEVGKIELSDDNSTRPKSKKTKKDADEEAEKDEKAKKKTATSKSKTTDTPPVMEEKPKVEIKAPVVEVKEAKDKKIVHQTIGSALGNNVLEKREEGVLTETKYVTLTGPKVQGKIEIPTERDKKSAADKKEKRKRVKKSNYVAGSDNTTFRPAPGTDNKAPANKTTPNTGNGPGNRRDKRKRPGNEFTSKEVQDTLKQTLNKMGGGGLPGGDRSKLRRLKRDAHAERSEKERMLQEEESSTLKVTEFVSANDLATMMDVPVTEVISACMTLGMMVSINQRLDAEMITIVAEEFGYKVEFVGADDTEAIDDEEDIADLPEQLKERAPIVTIMGHVDHGKTSLLDFIRNSNVVAGEAGGITQHLGAYEVTLPNKKKIAFIDTPGHEAFTAMRARGAKVTDIVIIVVAADDAVMPQTREAISHAQAAGVPIVFAFNKMDKEGANPEKIREQLASMNILVEEWGGKYQTQEISAKKGLNVDKLLEKVLIEADMLQLKANPDKPAIGTILEATMEKGRGIVASLMVQEGTLRRGDTMLAGQFASKVRAMFNERGATITEAGPSTPVKVLGFSGAPQSGDKFKVYEDEDAAKEIANKRQQLLREQGIRTKKHITLDEIGRRLAIGNFKELKLIVKADVDGSVQALTDSFLKLSSNEIQINVIHKGVGQISEGDVMLASASDAIIIGFQVRPSGQARKLAEAESIDIKFYSIIYDAINDVKAAMEGMLAPTTEEKIICNVEIREVFNITKVGRIAGCYVLDGKIERKTKIRIIRDGVVIHTGELASLKRFKDDVKEVASGYECGLNINNFNDIQVGDIIEGYEIIETKRKLA